VVSRSSWVVVLIEAPARTYQRSHPNLACSIERQGHVREVL
jgi:hypothetical protein